MGNEIDLNEIAVRLVEQNAKSFVNKGQELFTNAVNAIKVKIKSTYSDYLQCLHERHSRAKSFSIREEPVPLYNFYVPMGLSCNNREMSKASIKKIISISKMAIITGKGGSGKSTMMRHLLIDSIGLGEKIPVFVELRNLNQSEQSILDLIKEALSSDKFLFDDNYLEKALKAGHFVFFFDGFDEIFRAKQDTISKQIQKLANKYDENWMVVSSRIDNNLEAWQQFSVFEINDLTLEQACDLIQKVPYDESIKAKFIKALRESLYEKHQSFLSNPLLLSIMLLTYGEHADIPNKLSIFYNQAYETLFQRHDALKGGFKRNRSTNLDIQDFAKVFTAFSIQTYDKRLFDFPKLVALNYLSSAKKLTNLEFEEEEFLSDAIQAVNLLIEDGNLLQFTHRSFQEYFTACFIKDVSEDKQIKLIEKYFDQDSVIPLLYEMKPDLIEKLYIIPKLDKLKEVLEVKRGIGITQYARFLKNEIEHFEIINAKSLIGTFRVTKPSQRYFPLLRFTLFRYAPYDPTEDSRKKVIESWDNLAEKYGQKDKTIKINTASLSPRHPIIKSMADYGGEMSKDSLEKLFQIREQLVTKHQEAHASLDKILGL